jgi:glycosyltransferase involved in cell wall biosynthesis
LKPLVSVLLPVYNAENTLETCLRSLQRQTETRWQCVLVDDGSVDRSARIALDFAAGDGRIRVLRCAHRGLVASLDDGLAECRTAYVARMDADDWMHRERLARQLAAMEQTPELAAVGCHVRIFPRPATGSLTPGRRGDASPGERQRHNAYEGWLNSIRTPEDVVNEAFVECPIAHPALFIRRDVLAKFGYRDAGWAEDYDLVLRLLAAGKRISVVPERLMSWRDSPTRLSRTSATYAIDRFTACKAHHLTQSFLRESAQYILWGYGHTGRALRRELAQHDRTPSHIVELHPGRLGQRIHDAPVVPPEDIPGLPRLPIVVSVAGKGPRERIRNALRGMGLEQGSDFVCAA